MLQREAGELLAAIAAARGYTAILEYRLPLEARRPDMVVLLEDPVVVVELKGKAIPSQADLDQVSAYARDLRCYHRECEHRQVHAVLVPMRATGAPKRRDGVVVVGPEGLDGVLAALSSPGADTRLLPEAFLDPEAYRPLPTLVRAARELFKSRAVREIWRARAATEPTVETIARISHDAALTRTRHLVLVAGVPGSGKTLVGLRAVHAGYLDDLAVERPAGRPTAPAVFLSGNGPLVEVLQFELKEAGGGGRTFVRGVKNYLDAYVPKPTRVPPEHLLVFDEAQRAFSPEMVAEKHKAWPRGMARSEPQLFVHICERIPEWSVLVGLIGGGQEIHKGEEEGLIQWRTALEGAHDPSAWTVHGPPELRGAFAGSFLRQAWETALSLDTELRFHLTTELHVFVEGLLTGRSPEELRPIAERLHPAEAPEPGGIRLWITRDLALAKAYLRERYAEDPDARFGIVASSKDRDLETRCGIPNSYQATKRVRLGPWYSEGDGGKHSCRRLETVVTEFGAQGLELDMTLLAWGTDLLRDRGRWSDSGARGYQHNRVPVRNPHQLRLNAYRVLLTRGRDGVVVFVPPFPETAETWDYLVASGFRPLAG